MPQYVLKILIDLEARDDIDARRTASEVVKTSVGTIGGLRETVLHAKQDNKSIRMNADGTYVGQWNKGGAGSTVPQKN